MDRNKVLELALKVWGAAGGTVYIGPPMNQVSEFADLIEREVRGDAEPVAWLYQYKPAGTKFVTLEMAGAINHQQVSETPLYLHPAPAVVRQLVEAAKRAMNYAENVVMAEGVYFDHDDDLPFIESALAAAKDAGL